MSAKLHEMLTDLLHVVGKADVQKELMHQTWQHIVLSGSAVLLAICVAVPLGILLTRQRRFAEPVMAVVGMLQTIPSMALLAFMLPILGIGTAPALAALLLYALLPILRSTYTGIRGVDQSAVEAARGMGMTSRQMLLMVELPLAFRVIMNGVRVSTVLIIGWATLAAFVGGGGLGQTIVTGFSMVSSGLILAGGIPVTLMALLADFGLGRVERWVTPRGLRV